MRHHAADDTLAGRPAADPLRTRRFFLGGLAVGVIAMSAVGLATAAFIESPRELAARSAAPPRSAITAIARWEVLRNAITTQGIVRSPRTISVTATAPYATVTITRMPVKAGDRVTPGRVIAEVDGRPILLLHGRLPPYRDLHVGDHGPDVTQLQQALEQLGYADYDPPGYFMQSTALALLLFYRQLGYDAPLYHPPGRRAAAAPIPSAYLPMSEVTFIPAQSALVVFVGARAGKVVSAGPVLTLATGHPYVTGVLSPHQASQARTGMPAEIVSAGPRLAAAGTVTRIGSLPAVGGPPVSGYPIEVQSSHPLPQHLIGARVRLTLWAAVTSGPVLAVPLAAIMAARHGRPAYVVKITSGGHRIRVPIFIGPTADGLAAVQPVTRDMLRPGDRVLIGTGR